MGMLKEFKEFAVKGNMVDLAVGIIVGGVFGKVVTSLVNDILMPPLGYLIHGINFTEIKIHLMTPDNKEVTINIGNFIQSLVDFTITAFAVFLMVKAINSLHKKAEAAPAAPPPPTKDQELLGEIRDLLKKK